MDLKQEYRRILYQLEIDSTKSLTEIGKSIDRSQQATSYAVNQMEEQNIIRGYYTLFDYTKFGFNGYLSLFRVNTFSRDKLEELVEMFRENEMVAWVQRLAGGWDLLIFFLAPNSSYFNKKFKELISNHPEQLRTYSILTSVVIHDMERTYLRKEQEFETRDTIIGGDRNILDLKKFEKETCKILNQNPRRPTVEMAKQLDVTSKTVIDRIGKLEERNLVKGFRPLLGLEELDILTTIILIRYTKQDVRKEDQLVDYCKAHENITLLMKTFGEWDVIIRLETKDSERKQEVVHSLREKFEQIIMDYDTLEIVEDVKKNYLPPGFFDPEAFQPVEE